MSLDDALRRYREDAFTDHDVTRCTGLSVRAWRELIKIGAVHTFTQERGPGRVRLCDRDTFKRMAVIATLNRARFNLAMSGRIAYFLPVETLLYAVWDPWQILFQGYHNVDPKTGLPPRVQRPKTDWFDPDKPAKADKHDWLIEIYEGRFVGLICGEQHKGRPAIYGDLRDEGTRFVSWFPFHGQAQVSSASKEIAKSVLPYEIGKTFPKWEEDQLNPDFLDYKYEDHGQDGDPLAIAAAATARSPLFKTTVNVTLAIRTALRRYLGIEPLLSDSETGNVHDG
jgi:hypothetical protein